ncbi:hypothetical protein DFH07DRAFT_767068 [Mycena maculata]|uniref:Uncharacterized protein n=1 Tax=Mycena maculata TaxID=230809 RepID=A0AAD7K0I6_9AGAR|nr:hypothetical protein DFH07DRAFT_767068 [Mycena maculata]
MTGCHHDSALTKELCNPKLRARKPWLRPHNPSRSIHRDTRLSDPALVETSYHDHAWVRDVDYVACHLSVWGRGEGDEPEADEATEYTHCQHNIEERMAWGGVLCQGCRGWRTNAGLSLIETVGPGANVETTVYNILNESKQVATIAYTLGKMEKSLCRIAWLYVKPRKRQLTEQLGILGGVIVTPDNLLALAIVLVFGTAPLKIVGAAALEIDPVNLLVGRGSWDALQDLMTGADVGVNDAGNFGLKEPEVPRRLRARGGHRCIDCEDERAQS